MKISIVAKATTTTTQEVDSVSILKDIQSGRWKARINRIRELQRAGNTQMAKAAKLALPAVTWSGTFQSRKADNLIQYSGLMVADLDDLGDKLDTIRQSLLKSPHLYALFVSPSGNGLKPIFRVSDDTADHRASFETVRRHVRELARVEIDPSGKDVGRLCFVSHDPECFICPAAIPLRPVNVESGSNALSTSKCHTDTHTLKTSKIDMSFKTVAAAEPSFDPSVALGYLPTQPRGNNRQLFNLARFVRGIEKKAGIRLTRMEIKTLVDTWFDACPRECLSKSRQEYLSEFCRILSQTKKPLDDAPVKRAWECACQNPIPREADDLPEAEGRLAGMCLELQKQRGEEPFFLSCRSVAKLFNVDPSQAGRWLRSLEGYGLIEVVKRGELLSRKATEYRYVGELTANPSGEVIGESTQVRAVLRKEEVFS